MNAKNTLTILTLVLILFTNILSQNLQDYQKYFAICESTKTQQSYISLRKFYYADKINYLIVNPNDLSTSIYCEDQLTITDDSWDNILNLFIRSPYVKAIRESSENPDTIKMQVLPFSLNRKRSKSNC